METGSSSKEAPKKLESIESLVPRDHSPNELRSWAKRTGFVSNFSGEVAAAPLPPPPPPPPPPPTGFTSERRYGAAAAAAMLDLEKGFDPKDGTPSPTIEIDPILGRARRRGPEIDEFESKNDGGDALGGFEEGSVGEAAFSKDGQRKVGFSGIANANRREDPRVAPATEPPKKDDASMESEDGITIYPHGEDPVPGKSSEWKLKCGLTDNPGIGLLMYYGLQHYLSLVGSLILIPLIIVPAMGGTDKDTATVISTMLLMTGITTILHSYFGTRLPLVQGSSFVFMAPALVIMNSRDYRNLTEHKFRHIMRELQGGIIVGSIFQSILGFSGFMSLLVRLINPVVVAPTVGAVGLAFFSYGFPQAGSCVEISIPQIFLLLLFSLYLRGISIFGVKLFRIYAVPLSVLIIWAYAFSLTAGGAYDFKGCNPNIPTSNILSVACRKHVYTMRHCRTDVSNAWKTAYWVRIPYPFQWGMPIFRVRTSIIMMFVSVIASMDSVGTYYTASLHSNLKPPTRGIVSRGIGLEGVCSTFAGLWGSATGSTTLTENVHTINITKVSSRRAIELGAVFLIFASFIGKVGAILASIPEALAASVLCFTWALIVALGLSNLQYSQTASFRNVIIVGVSLFLGLSIPAYFQQYQPLTRLMLPSYFLPFSAASDGPVHTGSDQIDFAINALFSMNMVVTLLVAVVLDNTVPGKQEERGVYRWSTPEDMAADPSLLAKYSPPRRFAWFCRWPRCLGA